MHLEEISFVISLFQYSSVVEHIFSVVLIKMPCLHFIGLLYPYYRFGINDQLKFIEFILMAINKGIFCDHGQRLALCFWVFESV